MVFTMKFEQSPIFNIIFDISASKYSSMRSFKEIGCFGFSEVYPKFEFDNPKNLKVNQPVDVISVITITIPMAI